jgi:hypothetical protein
MRTERVDAVVLGGSIRGLVAASVLDRLGCRVALLDRSAQLGGADRSFVTPGGACFDHGLHVLDHMRSPLATRLFEHAVAGEVHRQVLRRAIVLRNHVMPYNPTRAELPAELRELLPYAPGAEVLVDELGAELPTRERLRRWYGRAFTDLVFDEVLPSYPSEHRHRRFGVDEARLLTNIYPWFFPRAGRAAAAFDVSRTFHDRLRAGLPQEIVYPRRGGFGAFAEGFRSRLDPQRVEVVAGAADLQVAVRPGTHTVDHAIAAGRRFEAPHWFWGGGWAPLCKLLDLPCQDVATDRVLLGSFVLDRPARATFAEYLVGDPELWLNRVSLPALFRGGDEPLLQVEFAVPTAESWPTDAESWQRRWRRDLERLGLLDAGHRVLEFDLRSFVMHFNGFGAEGEPLRDADPRLLAADSNVRPLAPSMANLNLNSHVPATVAYVAAVMAGQVPA